MVVSGQENQRRHDVEIRQFNEHIQTRYIYTTTILCSMRFPILQINYDAKKH